MFTTSDVSTLVLASVLASIIGLSSAFASGGGDFKQREDLAPAPRYSGGTPVDMSHGLLFNNGTYGKRNPEIEVWATTPVVIPSVSEHTYPYADKARFVEGLNESAMFVESAIWNWQRTSEITKPEAAEYSKESAAKMQPLLDRFKATIAGAKSAGKGDWDKAQLEARRALIEMRGTYSSLHNNVSAR
jgi:hypothetical protein